MKISLPHRWKPRPYQEALWSYLSGGGKRAVAKWHRRAGKDEVFLHHVSCAAHERVGNYWYMLPQYGQARKSMWDAVNGHTGRRRIDDSFPPEIRKRTLENEMKIEFHTGSTFQLVGSDNFNSLVGSPPIGLVFSEYALSDPSAWGYLRPILLENGGWAGFNSTPRGNNHFKKLCEFARSDPEWFYDERTADQTGVFTPEQLQSELREMQAEHGEEFGKSLWLQEYFCSFDAAVIGSIWGDCVAKARESGRIRTVEVVPGVPVCTAWDLGRTDSTAVWFFQVIKDPIKGTMILVVDYHESNNKDIDFYCDMLRAWGKNNEIAYGTHYLPHDARPRTLAAGGKSILQQFIDQKVGRFVIAPRLDVMEGIQAARATFPYVHFNDNEDCQRGLDCLQHYHREWDSETQTFSDSPVHDWSSHGADAWRYLSLVWRQPKVQEPSITFETKSRTNSYGPGFTFGALKNSHMRKMKAERQARMH